MASHIVDERTIRTGAPGVYTIKGMVYRKLRPMTPMPGRRPRNLQTYFYDPDYQHQQRALFLQENPEELDDDHQRNLATFQLLHDTLLECNNSYLMSFLSMKEYIEDNNLNPLDLNFEIHATETPPNNAHPGRYNLPTVSEVSLLMPNVIPHNVERSVVCPIRDSGHGGIRSFSDYHRSYDPLQYPVLFPFGTDGWNLTYLTDDESNCTLARYIRYHLCKRTNHSNFLHASNKLFQQCVVDNWCKNESQNMRFY